MKQAFLTFEEVFKLLCYLHKINHLVSRMRLI